MTLHSRRAETTTYNVVLVAEFIKSLETEAHAFLCANVKYTGEVEFVCTTCRTLFASSCSHIIYDLG